MSGKWRQMNITILFPLLLNNKTSRHIYSFLIVRIMIIFYLVATSDWLCKITSFGSDEFNSTLYSFIVFFINTFQFHKAPSSTYIMLSWSHKCRFGFSTYSRFFDRGKYTRVRQYDMSQCAYMDTKHHIDLNVAIIVPLLS